MKLPQTIDVLGVEVVVRRARRGEIRARKVRGFWRTTSETSGEVVLRKGLDPMSDLEVLVHELLHMSEDMLKARGVIRARVPHRFIVGAAFGVATMLVHLGVTPAVTPDDWTAHVTARGEARRRRKRAAS